MYNGITTAMEDDMTEERTENTKEIWVNQFTEKDAQRFRDRVLRIASQDPSILIPVYIDSWGGHVDSLAKMIETMDEVDNRFVTVAMGKAASCGAILLSHGDIRFCGRLTRVMIHNVSSTSWGDAYDLQSHSAEVMRLNKAFMTLLAENCGKTYDQLQEQIKNSTNSKEIWMTASDAYDFGIVDAVGLPSLKPRLMWEYNIIPPKKRLSDEEKGLPDIQLEEPEDKPKPKKRVRRKTTKKASKKR
jgi:ATP-dependent Clp protease protease subunit